MAARFERHDLRSCRGRILVAGDVHGRVEDLLRELDASRYDDTVDRLVLLGDLVNRGPQSHRAAELTQNLRIIGNHEDALLDDGGSALVEPRGKLAWMLAIGDLPERLAFARLLRNAPVMLEIATPGGHTVGFAHASVPFMDWANAARIVMEEDGPQHAATIRQLLMDRNHARGLISRTRRAVVNIDHVFLGHTPVPQPYRHANTTLCDTSRSERPVTVIDVDRWIDEAEGYQP